MMSAIDPQSADISRNMIDMKLLTKVVTKLPIINYLKQYRATGIGLAISALCDIFLKFDDVIECFLLLCD